MKSYLSKKRKGIGGIYFITCAIIGAYIVLITVNVARAATAVAMADDVAHVVATKAAIESYKTQAASYSEDGVKGSGGGRVRTIDGTYYNPLDEFNQIMDQAGNFKESDSEQYHVEWKKGAGYAGNGTLILDISPFTINSRVIQNLMGNKIYPHVQQIVIENK